MFKLTEQQKRFFMLNGFIEFEDAVDINFSVNHSEDAIYNFRGDSNIRDVVNSRQLALLGTDLFSVNFIRIIGGILTPNNIFNDIGDKAINDIVSVQGVLGVGILCLGISPESDILPQKKGDISFFKGSFELDFNEINNGEYLIICYGLKNSVYIKNEGAIFNDLSSGGYNFGETLKDDRNRLIRSL